MKETLPPIVIVEAPLLTPVPPLVPDNVPVQPSVKETAWSNAVAGVPPNVSVTLVSSTRVRAAGTGNCEVVASVPEVGKVTAVKPVNVPVKPNAPDMAKWTPTGMVEPPLFTPVPRNMELKGGDAMAMTVRPRFVLAVGMLARSERLLLGCKKEALRSAPEMPESVPGV